MCALSHLVSLISDLPDERKEPRTERRNKEGITGGSVELSGRSASRSPITGYSDVSGEGRDDVVSRYQSSRPSLLRRPRGLCAARAVASKRAITLFLFIIRPILSLKGFARYLLSVYLFPAF